ncbi:MAG: hypothetical protein AAGK05_13410 [Pseudomonadota bacterium]|uniref:hypothetical protein n=1 Tax=Pseudoalteromonas lipolytica TaxID=570156 RepID=UPI000826E3F7|nr:hypothetical protein [Pseudoalteromonas lipolytica]
MDYDNMDFVKFSDWQQVLAETNNSLTYEQCLKINQYIKSYNAACLKNNSKHVMPSKFQDASNRLNERIQHHESIKKPFFATYIVPILAGVIGAIAGSLLTFWLALPTT